jgi:hypothetical protein
MKHLLSILGAAAILCVSCTKNTAQAPARPEAVVQAFVEMSSDVKGAATRDKLASLCQGRMRKAIDGISSDAFVISYVNQPIKIKEFKIIDTAIDGNMARVHYQIQIENPNGQDTTEEINEREVEMLRVGNQWYLEAIRPKGSDQIAFTRGMIF